MDSQKNSVTPRQVVRDVLVLQALQFIFQVPQDLGWCRSPWVCLDTESDRVSPWYIGASYFAMEAVDFFAHWLDHSWPFWYRFHKKHHELVNVYSFGAMYHSHIGSIRSGVAQFLVQIYLVQATWIEFCLAFSASMAVLVLIHCEGIDAFSKHRFHARHHESLRGNYSPLIFEFWDTLFCTRI